MNKKFTLLGILLALVAFSAEAQVIFQENFNGTSPLTGWTLFNIDARTPNTNVSYVNNAWVTREDFDTTGVGDEVAVSTSWYTPAGASDDYLVTPAITLTTGNLLSFQAKAQDASFRDGYELRISTTTPTVTGLLANPALFSTSAENATWTDRSIDLAAAGYANQTVYLAWRNTSNDMFLLLVDNIKVYKPFVNDAKLESITIPDLAQVGTTVPISGIIKNVGSSNITSLEINWTENGGTVNTDISSSSIASQANLSFTHSISLTTSNIGAYTDLKIWVSNPNSVVDGNPTNDTINHRIFVNNGTTVPRKTVLEEFTTAGCQFCPDGAVVVEQVLAQNPSVIGIGVHACFGTDGMTNSAASGICTTLGNNSAPTGMIDRIVYPGESSAAVSRTTWMARANASVAQGSPVGVTISGSYVPGATTASVTVTSSFVDFPIPGNINLSVAVVEDSVTGTGSGYNQVNYYNTQSGHPYTGAGNPIIGYVHRHVLRNIVPSTFGDATVIPSTIALSTSYSKTFTVNIPAIWDYTKISLVAMVNYSGPGVENFQVLNAEEIHLDQLVGVQETNINSNSLEISPNPTSDYTRVQFDLISNSNVSITVVDVTGKIVREENYGTLTKGRQQAIIDVNSLENGFYLVNLKVGEEQIVRKISVMH